MPLWIAGCGYAAAALDLLIQRCKNWYARREQEQRIKRGDRVAVIGRGIAVVEQVKDNEMRALLWNRSMVRVGRREIVWDEGNARWETDASAPFTRLANLAEESLTDYRTSRHAAPKFESTVIPQVLSRPSGM